ncbi:MAG: hypothetical protein K2J79_11125, partial [Ruminiclostridium sp.]|nr:hypothetical protein [Ruminiclostridium sp.]
HYSPNRIIVNKIKGAQFYVEGVRKKAFNQVVVDHVSFYNNLIGKMYEYIETKLCGCHVIDYIDNVLSINPHKWGIYHLHFHDLYYQYDAKAIELICKNLPYDEEILQLEELRQTYIEKFELLNLKLEMTTKNDSIKWATNAVNFTQNLLMDIFSDAKFYKNLRKIKEQNLTVSILKSADIAGRVLLKALYKYEIPVIFQTSVSDFIFMNEEDFEKCRQANLIISANVHENKYLEKDGIKAILISDLLK